MNEVSDEGLAALLYEMREAARAEVLPRFLAITADGIRTKTAPDDLVTDADIGAERRLSQTLTSRFPGAFVLGEEAVSSDGSLLGRLAEAPLSIVIDPVDGTWNFAHGAPIFGMIVAIVSAGRTIAGAIHYPVTGDFLVARPGQGAWHVAADGTRVRLELARPRPVEAMRGFVSLHLFPKGERAGLAQRALRFARTTSWGCSAFEYRLIATGAMDFSLNASLMPWDHAAGALIYTEAGGHAALLSGEPYAPTLTAGRLLLAPDAQTWEQVAAAFTR